MGRRGDEGGCSDCSESFGDGRFLAGKAGSAVVVAVAVVVLAFLVVLS